MSASKKIVYTAKDEEYREQMGAIGKDISQEREAMARGSAGNKGVSLERGRKAPMNPQSALPPQEQDGQNEEFSYDEEFESFEEEFEEEIEEELSNALVSLGAQKRGRASDKELSQAFQSLGVDEPKNRQER